MNFRVYIERCRGSNRTDGRVLSLSRRLGYCSRARRRPEQGRPSPQEDIYRHKDYSDEKVNLFSEWSRLKSLTIHFRYNANEHPIPFHKAQDLGRLPKKIGGPVPDIEDAYDVRRW